MKRIAINGFGRIGRLVFRHLMEMDDESFEVVAVNDIAPFDNLAYLLRYDSVHKDPQRSIVTIKEGLRWGNKNVRFLNEKNPLELPWKNMRIDIAIESTGRFMNRDDAAKHLEAGASRVIVTAPGKDVELTMCMGVNEDAFDPKKHIIVSNASCTTNCLAPVAKVLDDEFGIETGFLTTTHAYTSSQALIDSPNKRWRRGRSAAVSIVPTTTGAAIAATLVLPKLKGKLDGLALRVPVPVGSIIDFVARTNKQVTIEKVNNSFKKASESDQMRGILGITDEELVSADIIGSTYSALVDAKSTMVIGENTVKVLAWYDNEWGYSRRVADMVRYIIAKI